MVQDRHPHRVTRERTKGPSAREEDFRLLFAFPHPTALGCGNASPEPNTPSAGQVQEPAERKRRASPRGFPSFLHEYPVAFVGRSSVYRPSEVFIGNPPRGLEAGGCGLTMPAPQRNHVQIVRCKGCKRCVPISVEAVTGSITVACPMCMERRSYIVRWKSSWASPPGR